MNTIDEKAYAKINISLDVTARRPDGYHDMLMVMQTVSLCDDIRVTLTPEKPSRAECNLRFVPSDSRNLAVRAADVFFAEAGIENMGAHIKMQKHIPVGAGMAGGSSDAAAVLRALDKLCGTALGCERLEQISLPPAGARCSPRCPRCPTARSSSASPIFPFRHRSCSGNWTA